MVRVSAPYDADETSIMIDAMAALIGMIISVVKPVLDRPNAARERRAETARSADVASPTRRA